MNIDYQAVLKELGLEERRLEKELDAVRDAIPAMELLAKRTPLAPTQPAVPLAPVFQAPTPPATPTPATPNGGVYAQMGAKEAIAHYLRGQPFPQMPSVIAKGLQDGGIVTRSNDFPAMITTSLAQMKVDGTVERLETGWRLKTS